MSLPKNNPQIESLGGLMGIQELAKFLDISPASLRRWELSGHLPESIRIGPKRVRKWRKREIAEWLTFHSNGGIWKVPNSGFISDMQWCCLRNEINQGVWGSKFHKWGFSTSRGTRAQNFPENRTPMSPLIANNWMILKTRLYFGWQPSLRL